MLKARIGRAPGVTIAATLLLLLGGCSKKEAAPTINSSMTAVMQPKAEIIWDTVSKAYNDVGDGLVAAKLSDADWKAMSDAAAQIRDRANQIADDKHNVVASESETIMGANAVGTNSAAGPDWRAVGAKEIQSRIDAKPDLFAQKARDLAANMDLIFRATNAKDVTELYKATARVDEVCDSCHEPFWGTDEPPPYPKK